MNILFMTSAMIDSHFSAYQEKAKTNINPSNQHFYSKLIKCLSLENNIRVVTLRPFVKGMFKEKILNEEVNTIGNISYYYARVHANKLIKGFREPPELLRCAKKAIESFKSKDFIVVTDTLRTNLLKVSLKIGKIYGVRVVGMLTDNPENLSFATLPYVQRIERMVGKCDAYLSLTQKLVDNINPDKKSYIFEGLTQEEIPGKKGVISNYMFFAGSLFERYGVKRLVDAFHHSKCKCKLILAGSGPLLKYIDNLAKEDPRILCLSRVSKEKVVAYEKDAIANINPRPLNDKMDKESIPSKLLEYLSIGVPIISTKHPRFAAIFKDNIYWVNAESAESLAFGLEDFENQNIEQMRANAVTAKAKAMELYGLKTQSESMTHFLNTIK